MSFWGTEKAVDHNCYDITLCNGENSCSFEVLDQTMICNEILPVFRGTWLNELSGLGIEITDISQVGSIELLIGADIAGTLYTGNKIALQCGLVALETILGWTIMGKVAMSNTSKSLAMTTLSLLVNDTLLLIYGCARDH